VEVGNPLLWRLSKKIELLKEQPLTELDRARLRNNIEKLYNRLPPEDLVSATAERVWRIIQRCRS